MNCPVNLKKAVKRGSRLHRLSSQADQARDARRLPRPAIILCTVLRATHSIAEFGTEMLLTDSKR
jgi:hypothetical protein